MPPTRPGMAVPLGNPRHCLTRGCREVQGGEDVKM